MGVFICIMDLATPDIGMVIQDMGMATPGIGAIQGMVIGILDMDMAGEGNGHGIGNRA